MPEREIRHLPGHRQRAGRRIARSPHRGERRQPDRKLDLVLLSIGANDINFSGLVADTIIDAPTERELFARIGVIGSVDDSRAALARDLPRGFAKLRDALKPLVGDLSRVVYVSYANPTLAGGAPCPGGRAGFDIHPSFNAAPQRLANVSGFVQNEFLPQLKALALCQSGVLCRDPASDRMTFVDAHQASFADHGFCARAESDPEFDRACFSDKGDSFDPDIVNSASQPLVCGRSAGEYRAYLPRARWIRDANDSYFAAMTYPQGLPSSMQPADIHDATWGILSAVYGGAIHPSAEGHAAMADAALPAVTSRAASRRRRGRGDVGAGRTAAAGTRREVDEVASGLDQVSNMIAGAIEDESGVATCRYLAADSNEMQRHGLSVRRRHDQASCDATLRRVRAV